MTTLARFNGAASLAGGAAVANAPITVKRESDGALAWIFTNTDGTGAIAQPGFQTDAEGKFTFCAAASVGGYRIQIDDGAGHTIDMRNVAVGTAQQADAEATGRSLMASATAAAARDVLDVYARGHNLPTMINGKIVESHVGSAATFALKTLAGNDPSADDPVYVTMRSATAADGLPQVVAITAALSLVLSSGSTLGASSGIAFRLWLAIFLDGATPRLAAINCLNGVNIYPLAGWALATTTAEGGAGAADSAHVFYTGTAIAAAAPYAPLGYVTYETGLVAAGTWAASPSRFQPYIPGVTRLPGQIVQEQTTITGAVATGTTALPNDDTIPQNTEGDQYMSQAITPSSAANKLAIDTVLFGVHSAITVIQAALFQDATAGALAAAQAQVPSAATPIPLPIHHEMRAGTSAATTFKVRAGASTGPTFTFNGASSARKLGGVLASYLRVREIQA